MKVHISYTVEVEDDARRQIASYHGDDGLASRDDVKAWYRKFGESMDMDLSAGWVGDTLDGEDNDEGD